MGGGDNRQVQAISVKLAEGACGIFFAIYYAGVTRLWSVNSQSIGDFAMKQTIVYHNQAGERKKSPSAGV